MLPVSSSTVDQRISISDHFYCPNPETDSLIMWTITLFFSLLFSHYSSQYSTTDRYHTTMTGQRTTTPKWYHTTTPEYHTTTPEYPTTTRRFTTTTPEQPTTTHGGCVQDDFKLIGGRCLLIDQNLKGNWQMMRSVCNDLGGDFPNFEDANLLADVSEYIHAYGLDTVSYWAGSNDMVSEGMWQWINDRSQVKRGTPLWGDLSDRRQQPTGGTLENCGALLKEDHYFMHDVTCSSSLSLICEEYRHAEVTRREVHQDNRHGDYWTTTEDYPTVCPQPYEIIGGKCLFPNTLAMNTWDSQTVTCQNLGGHMVKLDDANVLGSVYDYLTEKGISQDFWIGANDRHQENLWYWLDGTRVRLGTPFWGDDGTTIQNPNGSINENCGFISHNDHYFFDDADCGTLRYVICQIDLRE